MDWTTIKNAIHSWVTITSGLGASKVIWAGQPDAPTVEAPVIVLSFPQIRDIGHWIDVQDAVAPIPGAEIIDYVRSIRQATLQMTCYAVAGIGSSGAAMILEQVIAKATLPSVRAALNVADVGLMSMENIVSIDGILNVATFEPRAILNAVLRLFGEVSETSTYIEHVVIEGTVTP